MDRTGSPARRVDDPEDRNAARNDPQEAIPLDGLPYDAAMRSKIVVPVLLIVLLAGCGGSSGPAATANPSTAGGPASTSQPSAASTPAANGKLDCAAIKTAAAELINAQFLAQLTSPDVVAQVKAKQFGNLDPDAFIAAMETLHALDGYASPLGDPKAAIDVYENAAKAAKVLFATDPMTQAAIDTYKQNIGTVADFLGHQVAIAGALDKAHC